MAIADDFLIDYPNKRIYNVGTTVYDVVALYTHLMDTFDEQGAMDDEIPMSAQTPTAYTMINGWFIDDVSTHYLKNGAIKTDGYLNQIIVVKMRSSDYVNCIAGDIGNQVKDDTVEIGPLLAYDNTQRKWWVRTTSTVADPSVMTITGGTGSGNTTGQGASVTGEDLYANIYTLGTIESGTDLYIYQAGSKLTAWWSAGHIDVLIKVKECGTEIDNAIITIYAHVYTDLYDHYQIDLTDGGRNAVPLATSNDLDNQTAVGTALNFMDTIRLMFVGGTIPYSGAAGDSPVAHMVIHGQTSHATAHILNTASPFALANIEGTFQNAEVIEICEEIKFDARVATKFFAAGDSIDNGGASTAIVRKVIQDPQDSGTEGILFVSDVSGAWADNDPIEEGVTQYATQNGAMVTNTFTATTTATVTFAATINKDLNNGNGVQPYNVVIDMNGSGVAQLYELVKAICRRLSTIQTYPTNGTDTRYAYAGERYQLANTTYTQFKKASPFGTFAGGTFFGARGVWIEDMVTADVMKYSLIDADNDTQNPPTLASFIVSAMEIGDRVLICKTTGDNYIIDKSQFTNAAQGSGVAYVEVSEDLAGLWKDLPSTGIVRVRYNIGAEDEAEDIYTYTSIDTTLKRFIISGVTARAYTTSNRTYTPYIDKTAAATTETVTVVYQTSRFVIARVRKKGIIPFQTKGQFTTTGYSVAAIRTTDGIVQ